MQQTWASSAMLRFSLSSVRRQLLLSLFPALLLGATAAVAAPRDIEDIPNPYELPSPQPADIEEVYDVVGSDGVTQDGEIFDDLSERAICGGWDFDISVAGRFDTATGGKIPFVEGVPGRLGDPFGNLRSGMAARVETGGAKGDGYLFPKIAEVRGWSTMCRPGNGSSGNPGAPPFFKDNPMCLDVEMGSDLAAKDDGDWAHPQECQDQCIMINKWQFPVWYTVWDDADPATEPAPVTCVQIGDAGKDYDDDCCVRGSSESDPAKGQGCQNLYGGDDYSNATFDPGMPANAECNNTPDAGKPVRVANGFDGWHYCCTTQYVTATGYENCTEADPGRQCAAHPDGIGRNCVRCEGDGLGTGTDFNGEATARGPRNEVGCRESNSGHRSYYRHYLNGRYERAPVTRAPGDVFKRESVEVACYGLYNEIDAKTTATQLSDQICVIGAYLPANEFRTFYETQRGRGDFGQTASAYPDPDPTSSAQIRDPDFNADEDLWYPNLGDAYSLINYELLKEQFGGDLTYALLNPDRARVRTTVQFTPERMLSSGALIRATDDTVTNGSDRRAFVEWWQEQQSAIAPLLTTPTVWLVLPSPWGLDLDPLHPLFIRENPQPRGSTYEPRRQTIEAQLEARDDLLGEVADYLMDSLLLRIVEEPMTVAIPLGASTDFRAYKEGWLRWIEFQQAVGGTVPADAYALVDTLEVYAVHLDEVRKLRTELAQYGGTILERQGKVRATIAQWLEDNVDAYQQFLTDKQSLQFFAFFWQAIEELEREFHDVTEMPWCKNDRFTTPIYSLLDPWFTGRPSLDGFSLPRISLPPLHDPVLDFSALRTSATGALRMPVLQVVQVRYDSSKLAPPAIYDRAPTIPTLPALPPVPSITAVVEEELTQVETGTGLLTIKTYMPDLSFGGTLNSTLNSIGVMILGMDDRYKKFWDAVTKPRCETPEGDKRCEEAGEEPSDEEQTCCVEAGREIWCKAWNEDTCVHTEIDLIERFTRIGARPAVLLREDFEALGYFRGQNPATLAAARSAAASANSSASSAGSSSSFAAYSITAIESALIKAGPTCEKADWSCLRLLPRVTQPRHGWRVDPPPEDLSGRARDQLRVRLFDETLLRDGMAVDDLFPLVVQRNEITPAFQTWPEIPLVATGSFAPAPSASSSP